MNQKNWKRLLAALACLMLVCSCALAESTECEAHDWSNQNGSCKVCGYICQHPRDMQIFNPEKSWEEELPSVAENEDTHTDHYIIHDVFDCACGKEFVPPEYEGSAPGKAHTFSNGVCTACSYVCQHPHKRLTFNEEKSWEEELPSVPENENTHTDYYIIHDVFDCACGKEFIPPEVEGSAPGKPHNFVGDKCTACGYVKACAHDWTEASCTEPRSCSVCGVTEGEALGHKWTEASCTEPRSCSVCGETEGEALGHNWAESGTETKTAYEPNKMPDGAWDQHAHIKIETVTVTYACGLCGETKTETKEPTRTTDEHVFDGNGLCEKGCGYTCTHPHKRPTGNESDTLNDCVATDDYTHVDYYTNHTEMNCPTCGQTFVEDVDGKSPELEHEYEDGVCGACEHVCGHPAATDDICDACGMELGCKHTGETGEREGEPVTTIAPKNETHHSVTVTTTVLTVCGDCSQVLDTRDEVTTSEQAHTFADGVCSAAGCGYVCTHPEKENDVCKICAKDLSCKHTGATSERRSEPITTIAPKNETHHSATVTTTVLTVCDECGKTIGTRDEVTTSEQAHAFENGVCSAAGCGHVCAHGKRTGNICDYCEMELPCEHKNLKVVQENIYKLAEGSQWTSDGKGNHVAMAQYGTEYVCEDCDEYVFMGGELQEHALPCDNEGDTILKTEYSVVSGGTIDMDKLHRKVSTSIALCSVCEYEMGKTVVSDIEESHSYTDAFVCKHCGHACAHSTRRPTDITDPDKQYDTLDKCVATDDYTHLDYYTNYTEVTCPDCGKVYYEGTPGVSPQLPHSYTDGVCSGCGHVCAHPAYDAQNKCEACGTARVIPTPTPTPTPAPVPDDDDDDDRGNGGGNTGNYVAPVLPPVQEELIVEPEATPQAPKPVQPMVEKLMEAVTAAEEAGSTVTVEVVGAQEVMTEAEYTELKQLNAQEQVLVTLASIGFEDVVTAAVSAMNNVSLSEQAQTLISSVSERMSAATPEEKAALEDKLNEYFPVREIEMDGQSYPYFVMEMQIEVDGVMTVQYYGFRMDENGEWVFVMLREEDL
ncbi:MAG: hypothetical protein IKJ11_02565 [Clostridia bacterium]|nr:hypothetical protein [Clostridia bacterium]